ncbi:MAG TPA: asparagine synthase-related protein [Thermoanaerobaculia bacterium]
MSGIAGIVRLDGAPVGSRAVERLALAVAHRGGDGRGAWTEGAAAVVHAMLWTTPESRQETQPLTAGNLVITADVRLDHRAELIASLGLAPDSGDAALVAAAYERWGEESATHLAGDFSFAIWDRRARTLFCARDRFGVKPFVYSMLPGSLFAFGSEVRALLSVAEVPRELDEQRIADFLSIRFDDAEHTFYRALRRLPPASTLVLRNGSVEIRRYWSPRNVSPLHLAGGDAAYAEGFREHFGRAVRDRMRVADPSELGSMLSGGLDSTSIACFARDERAAAGAPPLAVISWIFSDVMEADEREYQEPVIAGGGMSAVTLDSAQVESSPWTDVDALLPDGPPYSPNFYLNSVAAKAARSRGIRVLLDGLGGDSSISRGRGRLAELLFQGRVLALSRELRALALRREAGESAAKLFLSQVAAPLMPPSLLRLVRTARGRPRDSGLKLLHPRIAGLTGVAPRPNLWITTERQEHLAQIESPMNPEGLELFDRVLAQFGVEGRYPFFDHRLVEYCVALPAEQKLADGYSRIVARRAMEGIVPDVVRWRAGKGAPGLHVVPALRASQPILEDILLRDPSALEGWVNIDVARGMLRQLLSGQRLEFRTVVQLWSAAVLGRWLRLRADLVSFGQDG